MEQHKTQLFGLDLEVYGTYYKGKESTWEYPSDPDTFEIEFILVQDRVDVTEMFDNSYNKDLVIWSRLVEEQILNEQYR